MREEGNGARLLYLELPAKVRLRKSVIAGNLHAGDLVPPTFIDFIDNVLCAPALLYIRVHFDIEISLCLEIAGEIVAALLNDLRIQPRLLIHWQ